MDGINTGVGSASAGILSDGASAGAGSLGRGVGDAVVGGAAPTLEGVEEPEPVPDFVGGSLHAGLAYLIWVFILWVLTRPWL